MAAFPYVSQIAVNVDRLRREVFRSGAPGARDTVFALIARSRGYVTEPELQECIRERDRLRVAGRAVMLGDLLLERGFLDVTQFLEMIGKEEEILRASISHS